MEVSIQKFNPDIIMQNQATNDKKKRGSIVIYLSLFILTIMLVLAITLIIKRLPQKPNIYQQRIYSKKFDNNTSMNVTEISNERDLIIQSQFESLLKNQSNNSDKDLYEINYCQNLIKTDMIHNTTEYYYKCGGDLNWQQYKDESDYQNLIYEDSIIQINNQNLIKITEYDEHDFDQFMETQKLSLQQDSEINQEPDEQQQQEEENSLQYQNDRNLNSYYYPNYKYRCSLIIEEVCIPQYKCHSITHYFCHYSVQCYEYISCQFHVQKQMCCYRC